MSRVARYALTCGVLVAVSGVVAALALGSEDTRGVVAAAAVALPVQIAAFALLTRAPIGTNAFLAAWVGGTLVRLLVVGVGGWALVGLGGLPPLPTLLSLAGFFFVMLVMEPYFLRPRTK